MISPGWEEAPKESDEWFCPTAQLITFSVHFIPGEHRCPLLPINGYSCLANILQNQRFWKKTIQGNYKKKDVPSCRWLGKRKSSKSSDISYSIQRGNIIGTFCRLYGETLSRVWRKQNSDLLIVEMYIGTHNLNFLCLPRIFTFFCRSNYAIFRDVVQWDIIKYFFSEKKLEIN